ncbi:hypothetical protein [Cryobacterium psychrophilum]|uniref:Uncharacterized protein n=1 Tax=Cryobacterium psychrophilum TaxID=41988 RepID=A0A4Y8KIU5_9MICO|nr:hypothetical protein [Cryobacterium psychrophilum]TDW29995.1 hypothetical protein EDD25_1724 [Cryobacterium psychrophilum]TFD75555.1 hypothetical protein E3T53_15840 [Cryobacterium psychrophilum]
MNTATESLTGVIGIDGHDGTGKTTIARAAAHALNASYQRPFGGERGSLLARAADAGDSDGVLRIGEAAIAAAISRAGPVRPLVVERSWLTVGSLVSDEEFYERWQLWIPTILCWADLPTTLERLGMCAEPTESMERHRHYVDRYRCMAEDRGCVIVDTSNATDDEAIAEVVRAARRLLRWASVPSMQSGRAGDIQ